MHNFGNTNNKFNAATICNTENYVNILGDK
jgi:hypothetical protein